MVCNITKISCSSVYIADYNLQRLLVFQKVSQIRVELDLLRGPEGKNLVGITEMKEVKMEMGELGCFTRN